MDKLGMVVHTYYPNTQEKEAECQLRICSDSTQQAKKGTDRTI
jgi:hypothetical protein